MERIQMVDLRSQYERIKLEIDGAIQAVIDGSAFIHGEANTRFGFDLCTYTGSSYATLVGSGTAALQIALMALGIEKGAEIITPSFSFIATVEVIVLLGYKPVLVDVDKDTMVISVSAIKRAITEKTRAIIPVHLFGQCAPMEDILSIARANNLYVIEDACQAIGASYHFSDGEIKQAGTMGDMGCISFFPSKNLGCFGDGGVILTQSEYYFQKTRMIANHGSRVKYRHEFVGINSRLDTIQAAILDVKLKYLDAYMAKRRRVAVFYNKHLGDLVGIQTPKIAIASSHVYHQYTIIIEGIDRDEVRNELSQHDIPTMVYYPIPIHKQQGYLQFGGVRSLFHSEYLADRVLSLPMHTELDDEQLEYIVFTFKNIMKR